MRRVTVADIKTRALRMADVPPESTSRSDAVVNDDELLDVINDGLAELHNLLVIACDDWLTTQATLSTTANQRYTYLPADFLQLKRLYQIDSGQRFAVERWALDDLETMSTTDTSNRPEYKLMSDRLWWHPLPDAAYDLELWYVRQFRRLASDDDELDPVIAAGWDTFIVAHVAEYALNKQEMDSRPATAQKERTQARIMASLVRELQPVKIRDKNNRFGPRLPKLPRYKA